MRVVSNTSAALVLEHRPLVVPILAAALVLAVVVQTLGSARSLGPGEAIAAVLGIGVGSLVAYLSALRSRVVFDAPGREVRWQHRGWPGRGRGSCPLAQVSGVEVCAEPSGATRLALTTSQGVVPLTRHFWGTEPHEQSAAAIRSWLERQGSGRRAIR